MHEAVDVEGAEHVDIEKVDDEGEGEEVRPHRVPARNGRSVHDDDPLGEGSAFEMSDHGLKSEWQESQRAKG